MKLQWVRGLVVLSVTLPAVPLWAQALAPAAPPGGSAPAASAAAPPSAAEAPSPAAPPPGAAVPQLPAAPMPPPAAYHGWYPPPSSGAPEGRPSPPTSESWYGWQTLLADGASIALLVTENDGAVGVGGIGYLFAPGVIHFAHGHVGKGFGSMGIRTGALVLTVVGLVDCWGDGFSGGQSGSGSCTLAVIGSLGLIAAVPIDALALAWEEVPATEDEESFSPFRNVAVGPVLQPLVADSVRQRFEQPARPAVAAASVGFQAGIRLRGTF